MFPVGERKIERWRTGPEALLVDAVCELVVPVLADEMLDDDVTDEFDATTVLLVTVTVLVELDPQPASPAHSSATYTAGFMVASLTSATNDAPLSD